MLRKMFYSLILKFNYVPRYGRLYRWDEWDEKFHKHWEYQYPGYWGIGILDKINLLDDSLETMYSKGPDEAHTNTKTEV